MDINLLNFSEIGRRIRISPVYCWQLLNGKRSAERRLEQIAGVLRMDVADLKKQIEKNRTRTK